MNKAAIYARVSTAAQGGDKASIPEQVTRCETHCQERGYTISDRYIDIGYSGAKKKRPEFQRMLADAKNGKFDVITCWKADRLSRGMYPAAALMEIIEPLGIKLEAVMENLDMNYFAMLAVVGKMEIDSIKARTKLGRENRARTKGLHPGGHHIDYGYIIKDGKIIINQAEAYWIKHLFNWVANGKSARSWCVYANTHGFVSRNGGQGVIPQQVSVWVRNRIYKGQYEWNKTTMASGRRKKLPADERIIIECEPIVSPELWDRVQQRLKLNRKYSPGNAKHFFLLRGLLRCAECGKSFVSGSTGSYRYYECYGTRLYPHQHQCRKRHRIKADLLEQFAWNEIADQVGGIVSENDALDYLLNELEQSKALLDEQLAKEQEVLEKCSWQRQVIATRERQGYLSVREAELQYRAINSEEEQHEEEIRKLKQMKSDAGDLEQVRELISRADWLHRQFNYGDFSDVPEDKKRQLLEEIVDKVIIGGDNQVEVRLKLPSPHLVEQIVSMSMHDTTCRITRL